jgi:predicted nuclease of restriction endonuclease-like (RecB) superfamily
MPRDLLPPDYERLLADLKERIQQAQLRAMLSVNRELVLLYWQIGQDISVRMRTQGWGAMVVDRLAADLRKEFPGVRGFSPRNLRYMRTFAEANPDESILQEVLARLSWYHHITLLERVKEPTQRLWYAQAAIQHGWSRNVLVHQIESGLYERQGQALTNFDRTLPPAQSDLAHQLLKDPYDFDFLGLGAEAQERDLERALLAHVRDFLLELGTGFAFVGNQYHLEVGGQDFFIDLLFYHLRLRCYVVIDLKISDFQPEYAGKMTFYLAAVNDLLRHTDDQPSIGLILCKTQNRVIAEYALRDTSAPMGVATYRLTRQLPEHLRGELPEVVDLQATLATAQSPASPATLDVDGDAQS